MDTVLVAAESRHRPLIGMVATPPEYYTRFGFRPGAEYAITPAVGGWKPYFLVRPLSGYTDAVRGTFYFPEAFG